MKTLHTVTAVIELGAGLALLCCPSATVALMVGAPLEAPAALTVARVGGAGLLALGVACLRRSPLNVTMDSDLRKQSNTERGPQ